MATWQDVITAAQTLLQRWKRDVDFTSQIVNGPATGPTSVVNTDGGTIPTFAKTLADITGEGQSLRSDLANAADPAKGAALVGFAQSGTGATATTVQEVLQRQRISVLDFIPASQHAAIKAGASSYDATADVQKAFDAALQGTEIEIPYEIICNGPLTLAGNNITLSGAGGYTKSMIKCNTASVQMLTVTGYGFRAKDITLLGDGGANGAGATIKGIRFVRADGTKDIDAQLTNVSINGMAECIYMQGTNLALLDSNFGSSLLGVNFLRNSTDESRGLRVRGCRFHSMGTIGLSAMCLQLNADAFDCEIVGNFADSIYAFFEGPINGTSVDENLCYRVAGPCINTLSATFTSQQRCGSVSHNLVYGEAPSYVGNGITLRTQNAQVIGNKIIGPRAHGIQGISATGNVITGNTILSHNFNFAGDGGIYDGISLDSGSTSNLISGNHLRSAGVQARSAINVVSPSNILGMNWIDTSYTTPYLNTPPLLALTQAQNVGIKKIPSVDLDILGVAMRIQKNDVIAGVPVEIQASYTRSGTEFLSHSIKQALQSSTAGQEKANTQVWLIQNGTMTKTMQFNWDGSFAPQVLAAPPAGLFADSFAYSDGTTGANNWGASGKGLYRWNGTAWVFVG